MKILVVHPGSGWILSHIAKRMCEAMPEIFIPMSVQEVFTRPGNGEWINVITPEGIDGIFFIDLQNCWYPLVRSFPSMNKLVNIALFTHADQDSVRSIKSHWHGEEGPDGIIHMAERYRAMFEINGLFLPERMIVLRPGEVAGQFPLKKVRIGICQRGEHVGKGRDFLPEVIKALPQEIKDGIELWFKGRGWSPLKTDNPLTALGPPDRDAVYDFDYHGVQAMDMLSEDADSYPAFYQSIDYLLIPGLYEGGPMSILEALATGLPVISSDVGWVRELTEETRTPNEYTERGYEYNRQTTILNIEQWSDGSYLYPAGSVEGLTEIITWVAGVRVDRRNVVAGMSYKNYAASVLGFFETLRKMK